VNEADPIAVRLEQAPGRGERVGIAVETDEPAIRPRPGEDLTRVAAVPDRGVAVATPGPGLQPGHDLVEEDGLVFGPDPRHLHGPPIVPEGGRLSSFEPGRFRNDSRAVGAHTAL